MSGTCLHPQWQPLIALPHNFWSPRDWRTGRRQAPIPRICVDLISWLSSCDKITHLSFYLKCWAAARMLAGWLTCKNLFWATLATLAWKQLQSLLAWNCHNCQCRRHIFQQCMIKPIVLGFRSIDCPQWWHGSCEKGYESAMLCTFGKTAYFETYMHVSAWYKFSYAFPHLERNGLEITNY